MYLTDKLRKSIFLSLCVIIAVALNYFESVFFISGVIPGIKIGISNIVILTVIYFFSFKEAILISILKTLLVTLLFGNGVSFLYSLFGGLVSALGMSVFKNLKGLSSIGVSMIGGFLHISVQIITAYIILDSVTVFYYYPYMLSVSICTGFINGLIVMSLLKKLKSERRF